MVLWEVCTIRLLYICIYIFWGEGGGDNPVFVWFLNKVASVFVCLVCLVCLVWSGLSDLSDLFRIALLTLSHELSALHNQPHHFVNRLGLRHDITESSVRFEVSHVT